MIRFFLLFLLFPLSCFSYYDAPRCFKTLPDEFFDIAYLGEALSIHNVFQSEWRDIYNLVYKKTRRVLKDVRDKARKMRPDPLDHPFQAVLAYKLMREALYDAFVEAMREYAFVNNRVINYSDIVEMFEYILYKQRPKLVKCFGKEIFGEKKKGP